ncbi:hypothetical protein [Thiomonas sp. X19]|nr:hypothetical protein [Thiomonas sp. X19]
MHELDSAHDLLPASRQHALQRKEPLAQSPTGRVRAEPELRRVWRPGN